MNEWMDEWMNEWINEWMNKWDVIEYTIYTPLLHFQNIKSGD